MRCSRPASRPRCAPPSGSKQIAVPACPHLPFGSAGTFPAGDAPDRDHESLIHIFPVNDAAGSELLVEALGRRRVGHRQRLRSAVSARGDGASGAPSARLVAQVGRRSTIALVTRCRQLLFEELPYLLDPRVERLAGEELIHVARVQRVDCLLLGDVEELGKRIRPGVLMWMPPARGVAYIRNRPWCPAGVIITDSVYGRTKRPASSDIPTKRLNGSSTFSAAARRRIASTLRSGRGRDGASACSSVTSRISSLGPPASSNTSKLTTSIDILKRPRNSCMRSRPAVTPTPTSATAISRPHRPLRSREAVSPAPTASRRRRAPSGRARASRTTRRR